MGDVVVTVPMNFKHRDVPGKTGLTAWLGEGDPPGTPWSGQEWAFTVGGGTPSCVPGDRCYVVCEGRLVGYSPLIRVEQWDMGNGKGRGLIALIRGGGAVACTLKKPVRGFRGWRYRWWDRVAETPIDLSEYMR